MSRGKQKSYAEKYERVTCRYCAKPFQRKRVTNRIQIFCTRRCNLEFNRNQRKARKLYEQS